jgi:hypothetical protein
MLQTTTGQRIAAATMFAVLLGVGPALSGAAAAPSADIHATRVASDLVGGPESNDTPWDRNGQ